MQTANRITRDAHAIPAAFSNATTSKVLVSCTTAGVLTLTMRSGAQVALNMVVGTSSIDNVDVGAAAWSGGGAGSVYGLA